MTLKHADALELLLSCQLGWLEALKIDAKVMAGSAPIYRVFLASLAALGTISLAHSTSLAMKLRQSYQDRQKAIIKRRNGRIWNSESRWPFISRKNQRGSMQELTLNGT